MKKRFGGLGIPELKYLNLCLLGSWVKRYISDEGRIWRNIVDNKYCKQESIFYLDRDRASPFGRGFFGQLRVKFGYRWHPGDRKRVKFWEDIWFGTAPLAVQF
jgi:hypothetical protein